MIGGCKPAVPNRKPYASPQSRGDQARLYET
jgi:hypothetical protein